MNSEDFGGPELPFLSAVLPGPDIAKLLGLFQQTPALFESDPGFVLLGNIELKSDEMGNCALLVSNRSNLQLVPEGSSVLAKVPQGDPCRLAFGQGFAQGSDRDLLPLRSLKKAAVASENLFR